MVSNLTGTGNSEDGRFYSVCSEEDINMARDQQLRGETSTNKVDTGRSMSGAWYGKVRKG